MPTCRKVMDALLHGMLKLGLSRAPVIADEAQNGGSESTPSLVRTVQKTLTVEPVKVVDTEGKLYVQYPSRTDIQFDDIDVKRFKE